MEAGNHHCGIMVVTGPRPIKTTGWFLRDVLAEPCSWCEVVPLNWTHSLGRRPTSCTARRRLTPRFVGIPFATPPVSNQPCMPQLFFLSTHLFKKRRFPVFPKSHPVLFPPQWSIVTPFKPLPQPVTVALLTIQMQVAFTGRSTARPLRGTEMGRPPWPWHSRLWTAALALQKASSSWLEPLPGEKTWLRGQGRLSLRRQR
jgi:hypothetical protein